MATGGLLGKFLFTGVEAGSIQEICIVPTTVDYASLNILVSNWGAAEAVVEVYVGSNATATRIDTVVPGDTIQSKGTGEWNCRLVSAGERIFVRAPADIVVRVEYSAEILPQ